jgi:hypothetical protein
LPPATPEKTGPADVAKDPDDGLRFGQERNEGELRRRVEQKEGKTSSIQASSGRIWWSWGSADKGLGMVAGRWPE